MSPQDPDSGTPALPAAATELRVEVLTRRLESIQSQVLRARSICRLASQAAWNIVGEKDYSHAADVWNALEAVQQLLTQVSDRLEPTELCKPPEVST